MIKGFSFQELFDVILSFTLFNFIIEQSDELEAMYVYYCNSRPAADEILDKQEMIDYWDVRKEQYLLFVD